MSGWRVDLVKVICWDNQGACLFCKRLEKERLVWPSQAEDKVVVSQAPHAMLLEPIEWRARQSFWRPLTAG